MAQDVEIEIKLPLLNGATVTACLRQHGQNPSESTQHDLYYNAPNRDFLENPEDIMSDFVSE